jgi:hypothetical protein
MHMTRESPSASRRRSGALSALGLGALAVTLFLVVTPALAGQMRCKGRIIKDGKKPGATMAEVLHRCGQPYDEYRNQWLYVKGDAVHRVYFNERGELRRIQSEILR